jgi:hypothetical protein
LKPRKKIPLESVVATAVAFPRMSLDEKEYWLWEYTDEFGKRQKTRYRMTEEVALERFGPSAKRVPWSREMYKSLGQTSDWLKRPSPES